MSSLLSLGFEYKGVHQSFLAQVKGDGNHTEYHITLMNAELEKLLSGNRIITRVNGQIVMDITDPSNEQQVIKSQVASALATYLHERSLTSY